MILALDLGTKTGWAFGKTATSVISGTWDFKSRRFEGGGMRYLRFNNVLQGFLTSGSAGITSVAFEEVRSHAGTDAAHVYGGMLAVLTAWCEENEIPYQGVPVGTIKLKWTGKGNASKEMMIDECMRRGFFPEDDNEADALAILHWAIEEGTGK